MKKAVIVVFVTLVVILLIGIFRERSSFIKADYDTAYHDSLKVYQERLQTRHDEIVDQLSSQLSVEYEGSGKPIFEPCILSNFEGAEVRIAGVQFFNQVYERKSVSDLGSYKYQCNQIDFDPDHAYFGLPNMHVVVSPIEFYMPEQEKFAKMFSWGKTDQQIPYKTYQKTVIEKDSAGNRINKIFSWELWLARFEADITIKSTRDDPMVPIDDSILKRRIYPGKWYGGEGKVSIDQLNRKKEINDHQYGDLSIILEVNPNASPWYIKLPNAETAKPDIAVGGVYCQHLISTSLNNKLSINANAGMQIPLYYFPFEKDDLLFVEGEFDKDGDALIDELNSVNRSLIWNRSYFIRIFSNNIGSRKSFINQQDDQVKLKFMVPLFVAGHLEVMLPSELAPDWIPPEPHVRKFTLNSLLPKWGLRFGAYLSAALFIIVIVLGLNFISPFIKFLKP